MYEGQAYPMLMSVHLSIVSRMILSYKPEFQEFLNVLAGNNGNHSDDIGKPKFCIIISLIHYIINVMTVTEFDSEPGKSQ